MRSGDLKDLVIPTISVDEYQSKLEAGDGAIVFGFYVQDVDAAKDLNRFIQKSPVTILDSEVSEAPDSHGFYLVFVDLENNERTAKDFTALLAEIEPLTDITEWSMHTRDVKGSIEFSEENLRKILSKDTQEKKPSEDTKNLSEFLRESVLQDARIDGDTLTLVGSDHILVAHVEDFGLLEDVDQRNLLSNKSADMNFISSAKCRHYERLMGENWDVSSVGGLLVFRRFESGYCLVLREEPST
jgi:hypothetical protein